MRYDHIGAYGQTGMVTPALDRLAENGVNCHRMYTQNALCMPSRCSFMTGCYPQQTGVTLNGHCLPPEFKPTVASAFAGAGYGTAQIGKLHFQPHDQMDFEARPRHTYGFDVFWPSEERGNYSDAYYHWLEGKYPELADRFRVPRSSDPDRHFAEKEPQPVDAPWQASHAGWIVETAKQFLKSRRDQAWFVHLGFYNPHPPLTPVREAWEAYAGRDFPEPAFQQGDEADANPALAGTLRQRADWTEEAFRQYRKGLAAMVTEMDFAIGALLDDLETRGELDDTLIVFSSDHGDMAGDHNLTHKGNHFYEACMRVPLILHWPAGLGTGRRDCHGLMEMVDLLPTLIELSGGHPHPSMAGTSVARDLLAGQEPAGRPDVYAYSGEPRAMLRSATHKYCWFGPESEVLYDLEADPGETRDAANDPRQADTLATLRARCLDRSLAASRSPQRKLYPY